MALDFCTSIAKTSGPLFAAGNEACRPHSQVVRFGVNTGPWIDIPQHHDDE